MYHPSNPEYDELCNLQRPEKTYGRFKNSLCNIWWRCCSGELESLGKKWNNNYPKIYKSRNERWATLSTYFKYPNEVRKPIYTTNAIEEFNRQLRKITKSKTVFPSDGSLLKLLYLATMTITKNGPDAAGTGLRYESSWKSTLKNGWKKQNSKEFYLTCAVIPV